MRTHDYYGLDFTIEAGDFIKARGTGCLGIVQSAGTMRLGKRTITGYQVTTARGTMDFIPDEDTILICPDEDHFMRACQERRAAA